MLNTKMNKKLNKFDNFMNGFAATVQLLQRAVENGFSIEYVVLAASLIDATLRMGLILKHQLETKTKDILEDLLFQADEDKIISERAIYNKSLKKKIISKNLFEKLESLYKKRNRVIHRYIISGITTKEVLTIGIAYEQIISSINQAVKEIEEEQIKLGVGMTVTSNSATPKRNIEKILEEMSSKKHDNPVLDYAFKNKNI